MDTAKLKSMLRIDEDDKLKPYLDTKGKLTIGVGRNLTDNGLRLVETDFMLTNDISDVQADLNRSIPWWITLSDNRQLILANMCFNMGVSRLMGYKNMLAALKAGDYILANKELLDSDAARDLPNRYHRLSILMEKG